MVATLACGLVVIFEDAVLTWKFVPGRPTKDVILKIKWLIKDVTLVCIVARATMSKGFAVCARLRSCDFCCIMV